MYDRPNVFVVFELTENLRFAYSSGSCLEDTHKFVFNFVNIGSNFIQ